MRKRFKFILRYIRYTGRKNYKDKCLGVFQIVLNNHLKSGNFIFYHKKSNDPRFRRYLFRLCHKSSSPLLNIKHISLEHPPINDRIPFKLNNSVPIVSPLLGSIPLPLLLDTGSPVNIIPKSALDHFETLNSFSCTRFLHDNTFSSHSNDPLSILEEGV